MRKFTYLLSLIGLLLFGGAFVWSAADPIGVESFARNTIKAEVEKRVNERIDQLNDTTVGKLAGRFLDQNSERLARIKQQIAEGLPQRIAAEASRMLDANCACRKAISTRVEGLFAGAAATLESVNERLTAVIRTNYLEVASHLMNEFRIFTGANALVFAALGFVVWMKPKATLHLILPTAVLIGGAVVTGYFYLFQQDWLNTIIFSDYVGWWYLPWLGFAIAWLADILLNYGRVTVQVIDTIVSSLGQTVASIPIGPC